MCEAGMGFVIRNVSGKAASRSAEALLLAADKVLILLSF